MARSLRFVYPDAMYHIMARGDGGKKLFRTEADQLLFLDWLDDRVLDAFCLAKSGHGRCAYEKWLEARAATDGGRLPDAKELRETTRKGDPRKAALAILVKRHTSVSNKWIAQRLEMGHDCSVSRLIKQGKDHKTIQQRCQELNQMLPCED